MNIKTKNLLLAILLVFFAFSLLGTAFFVHVASASGESATISHDSLKDVESYNLDGEFSVVGGFVYEISASVCSKNATAQTDIRLVAAVFDADDNQIGTIFGQYHVLNSQSDYNSWQKLVHRAEMPANAARVVLQAQLTQGRATVQVADISVLRVETETATLVEQWGADDWNTESGLTYDVFTLSPNSEYNFVFNYSSSVKTTAEVTFLDFFGDTIEGYGGLVELPVSANGSVELSVVTPSHVTAKVAVKSASGVSVSGVEIYKVGDSNMIRHAMGWNLRDCAVVTTEQSMSGYAIKMTVTDGSQRPYVLCEDNIRLQKGATYKLSYWVKVVDASANFSFHAFINRNNSGDEWMNHAGGEINGNCDWTYHEQEFSVSQNCTLRQIGFQALNGKGTVYLDDVKISLAADSFQYKIQLDDISAAEVSAVQDEYVTVNATLELAEKTLKKLNPRVQLRQQDGTLVATVTADFSVCTNALQKGENAVEISFVVPNFLEKGTYDVCLADFQFTSSAKNNKLTVLTVDSDAAVTAPTVSVQQNNGASSIVIDGKAYSALMYQKPFEADLFADGDQNVYNSGISLFVTYEGRLGGSGDYCLWKEDGSLDYDTFDREIAATLAANSEGYVMVNIGLYAPQWWLKLHPDEACVTKDYDGTATVLDDASFASELFLTEAKAQLEKLLLHMKAQPYFSRVFGVKLSAGRTYEWMNYGENGNYSDYSVAAQNGFRKWLTQKYGTDSALQTAWGNSETLGTATIPTMQEREQSNLGAVMDSQKVVDFNTYLGYATANALLEYAKVTKQTVGNVIVGGYNGYLWYSGSHDGITTAHSSLKTVLESDCIDFVASPANYGEKTLGTSNNVMSVSDTIRAYGKLYIIEQDNRTSFADGYADLAWDGENDDALGRTHTTLDTIDQEKRDFVVNFVNGNGQWLYDMEGGWLNDEQLLQMFAVAKNEWDISQNLSNDFNNEVAVFVPDDLYAYATIDNGSSNPYYLYTYLFEQQRRQLDAMGVGYDVYALSSLTTNLTDYKVNIMLSPISVSDEVKNAINSKLKKNGKFIVWVYLADYLSGGETSASDMSDLVGMTVKCSTESKNFNVKITETHALTAGLTGTSYGSSGSVKQPLPYVADSSAIKLGYLSDYATGLSWFKRCGLAYKDNGTYKTVYSSVPNLPQELLRNILAQAGVHVFSQNANDVVCTNANYIALHSGISEQKTIALNGNYAVYDVFEREYVSFNTNTISYYHRANDTKLFRLLPTEKAVVTVDVVNSTSTVNAQKCTLTGKNSTLNLRFVPQEGWYLSKLTVNGTRVECVNNEYALNVSSDDMAVKAYFSVVKVVADTEPPVIVYDGATELFCTSGDAMPQIVATATDDVDGTIVPTISVQSGALTDGVLNEGRWKVSIVAVDKSGNRAEKVVWLNVSAAEVTVQGIEICEAPVVSSRVGESLVFSKQGSITVRYSDGSTQTVAITSEMLSAVDVNKTTQTVTVTHLGHTATFTLTLASGVPTADVTPPEIKYNGQTTLYYLEGDAVPSAASLNISVVDDCDSAVEVDMSWAESAVTDGKLNVGTWTVVVSATDSAGNKSQVLILTVKVLSSGSQTDVADYQVAIYSGVAVACVLIVVVAIVAKRRRKS